MVLRRRLGSDGPLIIVSYGIIQRGTDVWCLIDLSRSNSSLDAYLLYQRSDIGYIKVKFIDTRYDNFLKALSLFHVTFGSPIYRSDLFSIFLSTIKNRIGVCLMTMDQILGDAWSQKPMPPISDTLIVARRHEFRRVHVCDCSELLLFFNLLAIFFLRKANDSSR